jgi:hypothetical protein
MRNESMMEILMRIVYHHMSLSRLFRAPISVSAVRKHGAVRRSTSIIKSEARMSPQRREGQAWQFLAYMQPHHSGDFLMNMYQDIRKKIRSFLGVLE